MLFPFAYVRMPSSVTMETTAKKHLASLIPEQRAQATGEDCGARLSFPRRH